MAEHDVVVMGTINYWFREKQYRHMQTVANDALRKYANDPVLKLLVAISIMMEGRIAEAMRELDILTNKDDVNLAAMLSLIHAHRRARSVDTEAVQKLDSRLKAERKKTNERAYYYVALYLVNVGKAEAATEYIDRAVKLNPQSKDILAMKGWHELSSADSGDGTKRAFDYFERALSFDGPKSIDAIFGKAKCLHMKGDLPSAIELMNNAIVMFSNYPPAVIEKMKLQLATNDWEQALDTANRALSIDRNCLAAQQLIIVHLLCKEGNYPQAANLIEDLSRTFAQVEPQNALLLDEYARLFCRLCGRNLLVLQQTLALQEKAVSLDSSNAGYLCELGYELLLQSRPKEAIKYYQNAYKMEEMSVQAVTGIIWCQLLDNQLENAISQLEFLNEVKDTVDKSPEVPYLTALVSLKRKEPQEKVTGMLNVAANIHASRYRGMPLGTQYLCALNPNFLLDVAKTYLAYAPQQPLTKDQPADRILEECKKILESLCNAVPGLLEGVYLLGKVKYLSGDVDGAMKVVQRCIAADDTSSDFHILMAQIHSHMNNFKMANQSLEQALSSNFQVREHPLYLLIKARILKKQGDLDEALKTLQAATALPGIKDYGTNTSVKKRTDISSNDCMSLFIELADVYRLRNEQHEAAKVMQDAVNTFKGSGEDVRLTLVNVDLSVSRGDVEGALSILHKITPEQSYYVQAREKMASIYLNHRKDKYLYAGCYRELAEKYPSIQTQTMLGDAYMNIQELQKAVEVYEMALKKNPKNSVLASKVGQAYVKMHSFNKAVAYYEASVKMGGQEVLRQEYVQLLIRLGSYEKAEKAAKMFIEQESGGNLESLIETARFYVLLSQIYQLQGQPENCVAHLNKAKEIQGKALKRATTNQQVDVMIQQEQFAAEICCKLGQYFLQQRNMQQAVQFYKEAYTHDSANPKITLQLAKLYLMTDDLDNSEHLCKALIKKDQLVDESTMLMSDILFRRDKYSEAMALFQQLLHDRPNHYDALERLIQLLRRAGRLEDSSKFLELAEKSSSRAWLDAGFNYCKGLYEWYAGNPNAALKHFNKARKDASYGYSATCNMVEICLNPDNETVGGEVFDGGESESFADKADGDLGGIKTAERLLKEIKPKPGSIRHTILYNMMLIGSKGKSNVEMALTNFLKLCSVERENIGALYGSAVAFMIARQPQKARHQLRNVAEAAWTMDDADDLEKSWLLLADINIQEGKSPAAVELLKRCLKHNRSCCKAYEYYGYIMEKEQNASEAMQHYENAWHYGNKNNPAIGYKLAFNYIKAKRLVDAIDICHQVLKAHPTYPKIRKEILEKARLQLRT